MFIHCALNLVEKYFVCLWTFWYLTCCWSSPSPAPSFVISMAGISIILSTPPYTCVHSIRSIRVNSCRFVSMTLCVHWNSELFMRHCLFQIGVCVCDVMCECLRMFLFTRFSLVVVNNTWLVSSTNVCVCTIYSILSLYRYLNLVFMKQFINQEYKIGNWNPTENWVFERNVLLF